MILGVAAMLRHSSVWHECYILSYDTGNPDRWGRANFRTLIPKAIGQLSSFTGIDTDSRRGHTVW